MAKRYLIVNADDFGQGGGVNQGIIAAHERGIVTSASLMVRWHEADAAAAYAKDNPAFSVGLHVDLSEWAYRDDSWIPLYEVVPLDDPFGVEREIGHQLTAFRRLVGREPTHLDSHQHAHRDEPVRSIMQKLARDLGIPLRHFDRRIRYFGGFYGQDDTGSPYPDGVSVESLLRILERIEPGITELGCHPGLAIDFDTMYATERSIEVRTLCDPRIRAAVMAQRIELCGFPSNAHRSG